MSWNLGSAALMVGAGWLYLAHGLSPWWAVPAVIVGLLTWLSFSGERKRFFEAQTKFYQTKAEYYRYLLAKEGRIVD